MLPWGPRDFIARFFLFRKYSSELDTPSFSMLDSGKGLSSCVGCSLGEGLQKNHAISSLVFFFLESIQASLILGRFQCLIRVRDYPPASDAPLGRGFRKTTRFHRSFFSF
jgi:hypothetical protein